eukprot:30952-Pelagococcus_subviridis.AAC.7
MRMRASKSGAKTRFARARTSTVTVNVNGSGSGSGSGSVASAGTDPSASGGAFSSVADIARDDVCRGSCEVARGDDVTDDARSDGVRRGQTTIFLSVRASTDRCSRTTFSAYSFLTETRAVPGPRVFIGSREERNPPRRARKASPRATGDPFPHPSRARLTPQQ